MLTIYMPNIFDSTKNFYPHPFMAFVPKYIGLAEFLSPSNVMQSRHDLRSSVCLSAGLSLCATKNILGCGECILCGKSSIGLPTMVSIIPSTISFAIQLIRFYCSSQRRKDGCRKHRTVLSYCHATSDRQ